MGSKVALVSLGCPKNLVDSEVMLGHLRASGYELTTDSADADVVVVNTCGFLGEAAQESVEALLTAVERKKQGRVRAVVAAGCMSQRFGDAVARDLPELDGIVGVGQHSELPAIVARALGGERALSLKGPSAGFEGYGLRVRSTPPWMAYLKLSEGCDRRCSFCTIPSFRGQMVSRPADDIAREAEALVADGVRELVLIGQDPTRYGVDLENGGLAPLLRRLARIEDLRWLRLMYVFPDRRLYDLLPVLVEEPKVAKYLDMPLQHVSASLLRAMRRPGEGSEFLRFIRDLRREDPDFAVRSTFILGFPGEGRAEFEELLRFIEEAQLDWAAAFRFSPEEGTPAADLVSRPERRTVERRHERFMAAQQGISAARNERWVGRTAPVLVESLQGHEAVGRMERQAPEIDGSVRLTPAPGVRPGQFIKARFTSAGPYDLNGEPLASSVSRVRRPALPLAVAC